MFKLTNEKNSNIDVVITVTEASHSPYFNMVKRNSKGMIDLVISPTKMLTRRQDAPNVYNMATVAYVLKPEFVMTNQSIFDGRVSAVSVPQERAIDIDTLIDFKMAEFYLSQRGNKSL